MDSSSRYITIHQDNIKIHMRDTYGYVSERYVSRMYPECIRSLRALMRECGVWQGLWAGEEEEEVDAH